MKKLSLILLLLLCGINVTSLVADPSTNLTDRRASAIATTTVQVFQLDDFPTPSGGVITLAAGVAYEIKGAVDIGSNGILTNVANTITGGDPFNDIIISSSSSDCIKGVDANFFMNAVSLSCANGTAYNFSNSAGNEKTSNFTIRNTLTIATNFATFENMGVIGIFESGATALSEGIAVTGSQNGIFTVSFEVVDSIASPGTVFDFGTAIFDSIRITNMDINLVSGNTFINGSGDSNLVTGGEARVTHNSLMGATPVVTGITEADTQWLFWDNTEIEDSPHAITPAGSDTEIQFNDGGVFGSDSFLNWNNTTKQLGVGVVPDASAILHVQSASRGFLGPAMTDVEADNIPSPANGLQIINITDAALNVFFGGTKEAISTHPTTEDNIHTGSSIPGTNETLAETLANGNTTGGNNIVITDGDVIVGAFGTTGAPIIITGGFGDTGGGPIIITSGLTDTGPGADWTRTAGPGGTEGGNGPGGDIIDISGSGNSNNQPSGDLHYKSGNPDGSGAFGDMYLMEDGGFIAVGHNNKPATIVDIQGAGPTVTVRNTSDFGRSDLDLYGSRNAGAGNAELGTLSMFNTRSGSDEMVARMAFVNGQSGTSGGGINFLTKENADGSLSIRLSIDDAGRVLINGEDASRVATDTVEIFDTSDFDALATGGVITVDGVSLSIIFKDSITSINRFNVINGGRLTLRFDAAWTYSGTVTALTCATGGTLNIKDGAILGNSSATLFDSTACSTVSFSNMTVLFFGDYGTIRGTGNVLMTTNGFFAGDSATLTLIDNASTSIADWGLASASAVTGAIILVTGADTGFFDWARSNVTLQSGESFIRFDPFSPTLAANISNIRAIGGDGLFETGDGATGAFTSVADASVALTTIDSVTDSSGIARFNFTVGPTLFVNQQMDIVNFSTQTNYNQTGIVTTAGAGFFEVASIAFTADDTTGDFSSDSITLTDATTTLVDGDTLVIDVDGDTDYDGGATVYNQLTNSFQINRTFTTTHTGSWDTAGIDQTDPRILANQNPGFVESEYIACGNVNNNGEPNGAIDNNTFTDMVFGTGGGGLIESTTTERWKLINAIDGIFEYTGNEPFDGLITFDFTVTSSGGTVDFRFKWQKDTGSGFGNLEDDVEALVSVGSNAESVSKTFPLRANKGDQIKPQVTRNSGTSGITTSYATIYATQ